MSTGKRGKGHSLLFKYISTRDGGQAFEDALESSVWGKVFRGCYLRGFSSEK